MSLILLLSLCLPACSDDDITELAVDPSSEVGPVSYLTIGVVMPETSDTRAVQDETTTATTTTDNEGSITEAGTEGERYVRCVNIYVFQAPSGNNISDDDWTLTATKEITEFTGEQIDATNNITRYGTATFKSLSKNTLYHLYAVVNATAVMPGRTDTDWQSNNTVTAKNFLDSARFDVTTNATVLAVSNFAVSTTEGSVGQLPQLSKFYNGGSGSGLVMASRQFDDMTATTAGNTTTSYVAFTITDYNSETNPTVVDVAVERVMARLDLGTTSDYKGSTLYELKADGTNNTDKPYVTVVINKYFPVNISKEGYLFRHKLTGTASQFTQTSGAYVYQYDNLKDLAASNWSNGAWTGAEYVVDPYTVTKTAKYATNGDIKSYQAYLYNTLHDVWKTGTGSIQSYYGNSYAALSSKDVNRTLLNIPARADGAIQPIGYCLENTTLADYQQKEYSTGLILGGTAKATDDHVWLLFNDTIYQRSVLKQKCNPEQTAVYDTTNAADIRALINTNLDTLYYYNFNFYTQAKGLYKVLSAPKPATASTSDEAENYKSLAQVLSDYGVKVFDKAKNDLAITSDTVMFTTFYHYVIKHYENTVNTGASASKLMSPMKFGVVRNNIYHMEIAGVNALGSPSVDPTDPDPTDYYLEGPNPDEDEEVYITMQLQVRHWVVRNQGGTITLK
jgi:hypothetical protein